MPAKKLQTNFTAGEISEDLKGRADLATYQNGAALLRNIHVLPQGGATRRPGTAHVADLTVAAVQQEAWVFSASQTYQLIFRPGAVDIHDGLVGNHLATLAGGWTEAMIGKLSVYCEKDYAFVAHRQLKPQQIVRTGASTFRIEDYRFQETATGFFKEVLQPYFKYERPDAQIHVQGIQGYAPTTGWTPGATAIVTAVGFDLFTPAHIHTILLIGDGQWRIDEYDDARTATCTLLSNNCRIHLVENPITLIAGGRAARVFMPANGLIAGQQVTLANATPFASATYADLNGVISNVQPTDQGFDFDMGGGTPPDATQVGGGPNVLFWSDWFGTLDWKEQMYSPARGWPAAVGSYLGRFIFAGGTGTPNRVNLSGVDAPFNFDVGTGADNESIQFGISGDRTPDVMAIMGSSRLELFTSEGAYYVPRVSQTAGLTPTTIAAVREAPYGMKEGLWPCAFDGGTVFMTRANNLRDFVFANEGYKAANLTFPAQHLVRDPQRIAARLESEQMPEALAYLVNGDGTLATFEMVRSEQVAAWTLWETQGLFKSVCAVNERLFAIVQRGAKLCLERFEEDRLLDGGTMGAYVGRNGQAYRWGGFGHLVGQSVSVVIDGIADIGLFTVAAGGTIDIMVPATTVEAGHGFLAKMKTMPPEMALPDGPSQGRPRRLVEASLLVRNTVSLKANGNRLIAPLAESDMTRVPEPVSGVLHFYMLGWNYEGQLTIEQESSTPFTVLSVSCDVEF